MNYWKLFLKLVDDGVNFFVANLLAYWYANQTSHICLSVFVCMCVYMAVLRDFILHMCCIIVTWWGGPGKIEA